MKLGNFFVGNVFTISQSPHGSLQGGKAIDAVPTTGVRVIAPCDMDIYYRANSLGHQSYSYARGEGFTRLVLVHCIIEKSGNVKRGEDIGYLATGGAVHLHTAIEVNGAWDCVLNYMDRSINLVLTSGFSSQHWKSWSTWKDLTLGKTTVEILKQTYEEAKSGFNDLFGYFEAHGLRADLARYVKDGGDSVQWIINHGRTELRGMFDAVVKERNGHKASIAALEKVIGSQNEQIADLQRELDESNQQLAQVEPTITDLKKDVHTLTSERDTMKTSYDNLTVAYNKCIEGQKGNVEDYKEILTKAFRALRKLLTRLYHLITKFNGRR
jgi:archaellum component FlaC